MLPHGHFFIIVIVLIQHGNKPVGRQGVFYQSHGPAAHILLGLQGLQLGSYRMGTVEFIGYIGYAHVRFYISFAYQSLYHIYVVIKVQVSKGAFQFGREFLLQLHVKIGEIFFVAELKEIGGVKAAADFSVFYRVFVYRR